MLNCKAQSIIGLELKEPCRIHEAASNDISSKLRVHENAMQLN